MPWCPKLLGQQMETVGGDRSLCLWREGGFCRWRYTSGGDGGDDDDLWAATL